LKHFQEAGWPQGRPSFMEYGKWKMEKGKREKEKYSKV